jgi:glutamyl-tRNA synthetase
LHLGNARTFLLAWLSVRSRAGRLILRIEDLDGPRVKPAATQALIDDLRWLGLDWDQGPDRGGPDGPYIQTERTAIYGRAIGQLAAAGYLYPCICSRTDIQNAASAPHAGEDGPRYPGTCRDRFVDGSAAAQFAGRAAAWRVRVPREEIEFSDQLRGNMATDVSRLVGDFVVQKNNGTPAYQLAVVVDDAAMGVNEVVRGDDLLSSTPRQIVLQRYLGLPRPAYYHVPLLVGPDGLRLAKRHGDTRLSAFREAGIESRRVVGLLAHWCGLAAQHESLSPRELVPRFDWRRLPLSPVVCDRQRVEQLLHEPP